MKTRSPLLVALAILVSVSIVIPPDVPAQVGQKAGEVSRAIPDVAIARGSQQLPAPVKALVDWGDVVHTGAGGRARVALDDGSVLNVGSSSSLTVTQHNAAAQQTQIELEYGRMRSQVVKQSKPNAKFEIHTPVGVAGVVGTDFAPDLSERPVPIVRFRGTRKILQSGRRVRGRARRPDLHNPRRPSTPRPADASHALGADRHGECHLSRINVRGASRPSH